MVCASREVTLVSLPSFQYCLLAVTPKFHVKYINGLRFAYKVQRQCIAHAQRWLDLFHEEHGEITGMRGAREARESKNIVEKEEMTLLYVRDLHVLGCKKAVLI